MYTFVILIGRSLFSLLIHTLGGESDSLVV